jgi:hypothetical protein
MCSGIWRHVTNLLPPSSGQDCMTTRLTSRCWQNGGVSETSVHFHQTTRRHVPQDINHHHHKNMENLLALLHCEDGGATNVRNVTKYSDNDTGWRHIPDDLTFSHTAVRSSLSHSLKSFTHSLRSLNHSDHSLLQSDHSHSLTHSLTHKVSHQLRPAVWTTAQQSAILKHIQLFNIPHATYPTRRTTPDSSKPTQPETKTKHNYQQNLRPVVAQYEACKPHSRVWTGRWEGHTDSQAGPELTSPLAIRTAWTLKECVAVPIGAWTASSLPRFYCT